MAGLTKTQWYSKFQGWLPPWFFETERLQKAHLMAAATDFEELQVEVDAHKRETYILDASTPYLNEHGAERSVERLPGESDASYAERVRNISNQCPMPALLELAQSLAIAGTVVIREHEDDLCFCDRETFFTRKWVLVDLLRYDTFSVILDPQIHDPYSFCDREYFCDRENFAGTAEPLSEVYDAIAEAIQDNKAAGTLFRLLEVA